MFGSSMKYNSNKTRKEEQFCRDALIPFAWSVIFIINLISQEQNSQFLRLPFSDVNKFMLLIVPANNATAAAYNLQIYEAVKVRPLFTCYKSFFTETMLKDVVGFVINLSLG